jgi:hypothetical protein
MGVLSLQGRQIRTCVPVVALALLGLTGCGPKMYPVQGKLVWPDGSTVKELAGGTVVFHRENPPLSVRGEIKADGAFQLTSTTEGDGAPPGDYRVFVTEALPEQGDGVPPRVLDPKYHSFESSGLTFTVKAEKNEPVFKVERNPYRKARR